MSEHFGGPAHDEQPDTESVTAREIKTRERLKDSRQLLIHDTDARVTHVDAHVLARTAAANEDPTFGFGIFDSVADQVSENATEKHRIAHDVCAGGAHADVNPLLKRAFLAFTACLPKQRLDRDGRELRPIGMLMESSSTQQLIELPTEAIDRVPTRPEQILLGFRPDANAEKFVGASEDLQWLSKIMAGHGKQHGLKIRGPLRVRSACCSQGYWLLGRPHDAGFPDVGDHRKPFVCVGHDILSSNKGLLLDDLVAGRRVAKQPPHVQICNPIIRVLRSDSGGRFGPAGSCELQI
jgi:hypothetical protein